MASLNKVFLMGNLTRNPELRYTSSGSAICEFGLAVNRRYVTDGIQKEETCFVDVGAWGRQAETCSRYLQKGAPILIEGRLRMDQWSDKETGKKKTRLRVTAERVQFLGLAGSSPDTGKTEQMEQSNNDGRKTPAELSQVQKHPQPDIQDQLQNPPLQMPEKAFEVDLEPDDDIPF